MGRVKDSGKRRRGCNMGPDAYRASGLAETLADLGHTVEDIGNVVPAPLRTGLPGPDHLHMLAETVAWAEALGGASEAACASTFRALRIH